jgi:hypothetical protein
MPDADSLYNIVMEQSKLPAAPDVSAKLSMFEKAHDRSVHDRYKIVKKGAVEVSSDKIVDLIFDKDPAITQKREGILGKITQAEFVKRFDEGRDRVTPVLNDLKDLFGLKSFPETYFHPNIARVLAATGKLTDSGRVQDRILETGMVVADALAKDHGFAIMLAIAESHKHRNRDLYTADTVEYTLLTFSYFGAKAAKIKEGDWFFYWRVFGSLMGLPPAHLHNNLEEAKKRMGILHQQCPDTALDPPDSARRKLLDAFIEWALSDASDIREACGKGFVSKRMEKYLRETKRWPEGLARAKREDF